MLSLNPFAQGMLPASYNDHEPSPAVTKRKVKSLSHVRFFATPWTVAYQAPLSMGFSRQEYWSGLPFPSPGDLPYPGSKPRSPTLQADASPSEPPNCQIKYTLNVGLMSPFSEKEVAGV